MGISASACSDCGESRGSPAPWQPKTPIRNARDVPLPPPVSITPAQLTTDIHHGAATKLQALRRGSATRASNQRWAKLRNAVKTKLLMIMEVKHSDGEIDRIHIHEGDDPEDLAEAFVAKYDLPEECVSVLSSNILNNVGTEHLIQKASTFLQDWLKNGLAIEKQNRHGGFRGRTLNLNSSRTALSWESNTRRRSVGVAIGVTSPTHVILVRDIRCVWSEERLVTVEVNTASCSFRFENAEDAVIFVQCVNELKNAIVAP